MEYSAQASMLSAIYASRSRQALNTSITRLSSGVRINRAADDASGLAIADRLDALQGLRGDAEVQGAFKSLDADGNTIHELS